MLIQEALFLLENSLPKGKYIMSDSTLPTTRSFKNPITEMLGIELPIIGAPMFLVSYPELVAAVSNAGGLGAFPSANYRTAEELKAGLHEIREKTDKPFGVNIILHKEHNPGRDEQIDVCIEEGVKVLILSMGTPRSVIPRLRDAGIKVICDVTNLRMARIVEKSGADALIAVTQGAGGHAGDISPLVLIPQLVAETSLPVIAAGGISNGAQMAAALALGAGAVSVGTRLIATPESKASQEYKETLLEIGPEEIVYTPEVSGIPGNFIKSALDKVHELKSMAADDHSVKTWADLWSAGQGVAQVKEITPAAQIIEEMILEYEIARENLP